MFLKSPTPSLLTLPRIYPRSWSWPRPTLLMPSTIRMLCSTLLLVSRPLPVDLTDAEYQTSMLSRLPEAEMLVSVTLDILTLTDPTLTQLHPHPPLRLSRPLLPLPLPPPLPPLISLRLPPSLPVVSSTMTTITAKVPLLPRPPLLQPDRPVIATLTLMEVSRGHSVC